jgi:hypothetical protein
MSSESVCKLHVAGWTWAVFTRVYEEVYHFYRVNPEYFGLTYVCCMAILISDRSHHCHQTHQSNPHIQHLICNKTFNLQFLYNAETFRKTTEYAWTYIQMCIMKQINLAVPVIRTKNDRDYEVRTMH